MREICKKFLDERFLVIQEGTIPSIHDCWCENRFNDIKVASHSQNWRKKVNTWKEPDLFILENNQITKVVEVLGTADDYIVLASKVAKIKEFIEPSETIIFDAIKFVDRQHLNEKRKRKLQEIMESPSLPSTYEVVDQYYKRLLEEKYGLKFTLWSEKDLTDANARET